MTIRMVEQYRQQYCALRLMWEESPGVELSLCFRTVDEEHVWVVVRPPFVTSSLAEKVLGNY